MIIAADGMSCQPFGVEESRGVARSFPCKVVLRGVYSLVAYALTSLLGFRSCASIGRRVSIFVVSRFHVGSESKKRVIRKKHADLKNVHVTAPLRESETPRRALFVAGKAPVAGSVSISSLCDGPF